MLNLGFSKTFKSRPNENKYFYSWSQLSSEIKVNQGSQNYVARQKIHARG